MSELKILALTVMAMHIFSLLDRIGLADRIRKLEKKLAERNRDEAGGMN